MRVPNLHEYPLVMPFSARAGCCAEFARSGDAARPASVPHGGRISLHSLVSVLPLSALIGGLAYGAYALLQDLQRVGFAPLTLAPETFATAPLFRRPAMDLTRSPDSGLPNYDWDGYQPAATPAGLLARDGPISEVDPETSGLFAARRSADAATPPATGTGFLASHMANSGNRITLSLDEAALAEPMLVTAHEASQPKVVLHATNETWIRIRDGEAVIFEGILQPGGQYEVPTRARAPLLRTGNAGALYALVKGTSYGPVGSSSVLLKNMSLRAGDIVDQVPAAIQSAVHPGAGGGAVRLSEAGVGQ